MPLSGKNWACTRCGHPLGRIVRGELIIKGAADVNTNGASLVVTCPHCGHLKTWFPSLEHLVDQFLYYLAKRYTEIAMARASSMMPATDGMAPASEMIAPGEEAR